MLTGRIEIKNFNKNLTLNDEIKKQIQMIKNQKKKKHSLAHNVGVS
jgi:hypothetical protein